ncbi:hypothetical protein [uncultured Lactobacillus sp.]|uniref:hypothetical protein n=1 Tax=uncultured Lactobacillus sp. TaxID=153152 RepID=UPI0025FDC930|nr:hypothetical protein [uncultured Lactobacillus sp.]
MRLIKVSQDPRDLSWEQALDQLEDDDVLMLAPGFYQIPFGKKLKNIVIKGTGTAPDMTTLVGTVILDGRYLTLENLAVKTKAIAGALVRVDEGENAPYLTLRGCRLEAADTALMTQGPVWLELYSCQVKGVIRLVGDKEQHVQISSSEIAATPAAFTGNGFGLLAISQSQIKGDFVLEESSAYEGHFDQTAFDQVTSLSEGNDLYVTESALSLTLKNGQADLLNCDLPGTALLEKAKSAAFQNCTFKQFKQVSGSSNLTNCHLEVGEIMGQGKAFFCRPHFSCSEGTWLSLSGSVQVRLQDALLNVAGSHLRLADKAGILGNILESDQDQLLVKQTGRGKVKLTGIKCKLV